ncbi:MAG TPA: hypothetical protein DEW22_03995 [Clostridiales bacterium]|nr:hypothetical protein [Clostridiales bacterium]
MCGGSNLSTDLALWGIYIKKCISLVRICLQTRKPRKAQKCIYKISKNFRVRKIAPSAKQMGREESLEISAFLPCGTLQGGFRACI